ncbi:DUF2945 domain-containing protein [Hyphobacterium sp.]|uniref:DUF2945 domain-containing protein n=1 Tax=Hyphobacterium sp. TaxID=2004662 RepID=UPI003BA88935
MSKQYSQGTEVEWDWGNGTAKGEVSEIHTDDVQKTLQGASVKREASGDSPAYTIVQEDGTHVLKSHSEVRKAS